MQELLDRLQKATDVDPQLEHDIEIWRAGWHAGTRLSIYPGYTRSVDDALKLIPEGWSVVYIGPTETCLIKPGDGFLGAKGDMERYGQGETMALAICSAAMLARIADGQGAPPTEEGK